MTTTRRNRQPSGRAFSLIELMIVILIIAMIIAIVVPALGHARKGGRNAATRNLMVQIDQACSSFQLSERRLPGYFTELDMGSTENASRGFTEMENVMFELAGGIVPTDAAHPAYYGPVAARSISYDVTRVGVFTGAIEGAKGYFAPPAKYFKLQNNIDGGAKVTSVSQHKDYIKDIVDAEGTPILMWRTDVMSVQPIGAPDDFAKPASGGANAPARYYWNTNAAFLQSTECGDKRINETDNVKGSLLGATSTPAAGSPQILTMVGVLGNPNSPNNLTPPLGQSILPSAGRGAFILHAAGSDATFVGKQERGGKTATGGNTLGYELNFLRGNPSSDVMHDFDDILVAGGS